jgi:hypothetical protein
MKKVRDFLALWTLILLIGWILSGCATPPAQVVEVRVPVPVPCSVAEPARPALGIDSLPIEAPVDVLVRNLRADHDVRDGYEGELRAALKACREIGAQ